MSRIYIGRKTHQNNKLGALDCELSTSYWDAFGVLLEEVFLFKYPMLHEEIARDEFTIFEYYSFTELSLADFNLVVKLIREYLQILNQSEWADKDWITDVVVVKSRARQVWQELVEPLVTQDDRYDAKLAECKN